MEVDGVEAESSGILGELTPLHLNNVEESDMTCIFESNLRNDPTHNRHILREEADYTQKKVIQIAVQSVCWGDSGDIDDYEETNEEWGTKTFEDAESVYRYLSNNGYSSMDSTGSDWWQTESPEQDREYFEDGVEKTYSAAPVSGFTDDEIDYINGRLDGTREEEEEYSDDLSYYNDESDSYDDWYSRRHPKPTMESCVFGSNLLGHGGYGNSILREEADCIGIRCARPKNGYCSDIEEVDKPEYEKPEVKKTPRLCAKRNRRLRSKTRNIQLWDTKKKRFAPEWGNTRFTRMKDANDAIAKLGEAKDPEKTKCECGRDGCDCGCTPLAAGREPTGKAKRLHPVKRIRRKSLPPGKLWDDED